MFWRMSIVVPALVLAGCVNTGTVKLDEEASKTLPGKTLVVSTSDRPDFAAMTAGKAMFAMIGAIAMISAGNEIIQENNVEDPAVFIGNELGKKLAELQAMELEETVVSGNESELSAITAQTSNKDFAIDVRTINWSFGYFPTDWDSYRVMYSAKARLIDLKAQSVIAEAFCFRAPEQTPEAPSYDELLNENAARLKSELRSAAEQCADELGDKLL